MNLNLTGFFRAFNVLTRPSLSTPHHTVSAFSDLPIPLDKVLRAKGIDADIRAVVLDKDDCFALPDATDIYPAYKDRFEALRAAYPGRRLLVVSNTAGSKRRDPSGQLAASVEAATGVPVLAHDKQKPGCAEDVMAYFAAHPETGVTRPDHIAVVGDRLATDVMMANLMGAWAFWVRDGVVPLSNKSVFAQIERPFASFILQRVSPPNLLRKPPRPV